MAEFKIMEENNDMLYNCALCPNMCSYICPVLDASKNEGFSPSKKAKFAVGYLENFFKDVPIKDKIADANPEESIIYPLYACLNCKACIEACPYDELDLGELLRETREVILSNKKENFRHKDLIEAFQKSGNPFGEKIHDELSEIIRETNKSQKIAFFTPCSAASNTEKTLSNAIEQLKNIIPDLLIIPPYDTCCGNELYEASSELFGVHASSTYDKLKDLDIDLMVTICPTCTYTFTRLYKELDLKFPFEIKHAAEFLNDLLINDKISVQKRKEFESTDYITYHDPCKMTRFLSLLEQPRFILQKAGFEIKEPVFTGKETFCCGNGGIFPKTNINTANLVAQKRLDQLLDQSSTIATTCQSCQQMFSQNLETPDSSGKNNCNEKIVADLFDLIIVKKKEQK